MLALAFTGKNLFRLLESPDSPAGIGKDTAYRLLNSVTANWRSQRSGYCAFYYSYSTLLFRIQEEIRAPVLSVRD